ncbi:hypothetical protein ACFXPT_30065 [Streptomyces goshikiensis]|uniref:hypothetical protein n=1 Tax=Streptomyces goshikiensis TaxID=1942 RepID=UPI0036BE6D21
MLGFFLVLGLVGVWVSGFLMSAQSWLADHLWVLALSVAALACVIAVGMYLEKEQARRKPTRAQGLRYVVEHLDGLHYTRFEYAVRDLLRRDGCPDTQQAGRVATWEPT